MSSVADVHIGEPGATSGIAHIHVGKPNDKWPRVEERVQIHFHNFADLPQQKGTELCSSKFSCAGHEWFLELYPRGDSSTKEGMISIFLGTDLTSKIVVDFVIIMRKKNGDSFRLQSDTKA